MARHASAVKAARQAVKHNERNRLARTKYKTLVKKLRLAIVDKKKTKETLHPLLNEVQRVLMKAASKDIIKRGTASRQISRLSAAVHKALA